MRKGLRLGVDLGGTQVKMALVDERGVVRERTRVDTVRDPRRLVGALRQAVTGWTARRILGTGVGVAGDIDPAAGVVRVSPNLGWRRVPLRELFRKAGFPAPLRFDNDATAAAWGAFHVEKGLRSRHLVVLTLGTGVGGGLVLDGRLHRGATGTAGEIGHMVVEGDGDPCACGNRGCLEAYAGGAAMTRWAAREYGRRGRIPGEIDPRRLAAWARSGDPVARSAWQRAARALGVGLVNLVNLLNPDAILLAGGLARSAALLLPQARRELAAHAFRTAARAVRVRVARNGSDLGVTGAALLVE